MGEKARCGPYIPACHFLSYNKIGNGRYYHRVERPCKRANTYVRALKKLKRKGKLRRESELMTFLC